MTYLAVLKCINCRVDLILSRGTAERAREHVDINIRDSISSRNSIVDDMNSIGVRTSSRLEASSNEERIAWVR